MSPPLLRLSFLLVFIGFGAKTGFAPMHTWLPDAHSEAPTPVCAVLSGVKTSVPLYVILRFLGVVLASPEARVGEWMVVIGLISVAIGAFLLLQVQDYKRMFAYSTVEHMGIILTGAGLASRASDFGAVFQMLNHAITKSLCFYVAGVVLLTVGTREIKSVKGLLRTSPFAGAVLIFCALAIAGAPPFPIFLSEFSILSAGMRDGHPVAVSILAALIVVAFIGIMLQVNRMTFGRPERIDAGMSFWFWRGLQKGVHTTRYPAASETAAGVTPGRPVTTEFSSAEEAALAAASLSSRRDHDARQIGSRGPAPMYSLPTLSLWRRAR